MSPTFYCMKGKNYYQKNKTAKLTRMLCYACQMLDGHDGEPFNYSEEKSQELADWWVEHMDKAGHKNGKGCTPPAPKKGVDEEPPRKIQL